MATPRRIDIIRDCGLKIELTEVSSYLGNDVTDSSLPWEYRITYPTFRNEECQELNQEGQESRLNGWISPIAPITLPVDVREEAGIPKIATTFAFMHPPQGLAGIGECILDELEYEDDEKEEKEEGIKSAIILGGFVYFDEDNKCVCVNALSKKKKEEKNIRFLGVFEVNKSTCIELQKRKKCKTSTVSRAQALTLGRFREAGFVSFAWVCPEEKFSFKPIFTDHENKDGAFVFFREDGTAAAYAVDATEDADPTGYVGILSDVFAFTDESNFSSKTIKSVGEVNAWKTKYENLISPIQSYASASYQIMLSSSRRAILLENTDELVKTLDDRKTLFHMACHANLGIDFIHFMLKYNQKKDELLGKDEFGWTPLHYACRFSPRNEKVIKLLVKECKGAVLESDNYGRYPLHIACDSDTSAEVVTALIKADTTNEKVTITKSTHRLKILPIHFACYQSNASESILKALLDADKDGRTAVKKTDYGQLPLHIAIIKKLPASMVKMLLDADSKLQSVQDYTADIYHPFEGKLPLHWACWNNSSDEIIELLLEKDEQNKTIYETLRFNVEELIINDDSSDDFNLTDPDLERENVTNGRKPLLKNAEHNRSESNLLDTSFSSDDGVALHLAIKHNCTDVIGLLLQKETENEDNERPTIYKIEDNSGRTPLHIACKHNIDSQVIRALVKLDLKNETIQMCDENNFTPLLHACSNKETTAETVNILCNAESKCAKTIKAKFSPLSLAIKASVTPEVIERLLQPETFCLDGLDESSKSGLAVYIGDNDAIQDRVIDIMSDRLYFTTLMLEFYANIFALYFLAHGSSELRAGCGSSSIRPLLPLGLLSCTIIFLVREFLQVLSEGGSAYIRDHWSWIELITIIFLLATVKHMLYEVEDPEQDLNTLLLQATGFLLVLQFIFILRATLLPFARFVGGLLMIVRKMVPFLIILILMNLAFTYMYWITDHEKCGSIGECSKYMYGHLFNFAPQDEGVSIYDVLFGFVIIIVLLNVVIAIVSETWKSTEARSLQFLWESRLQRISQLQVVVKLRNRLEKVCPTVGKFSPFHFIDNLKDVSYDNNVTWTEEPYVFVTKKKQYDDPEEFFKPDIAAKINMAKSLKADLHWAQMDARNKDGNMTSDEAEMDARNEGRDKTCGQLASLQKIMYIFKWVGSLMLYVLLIILGTFTFGICWPKNFRSGVLSVDYSD